MCIPANTIIYPREIIDAFVCFLAVASQMAKRAAPTRLVNGKGVSCLKKGMAARRKKRMRPGGDVGKEVN